ncbi:hypothetical protein ABMA77_08825 [Halobacteriovorax sp. RZ-1]|uniref:hypothetical protein n=1 Tax=unclassified Halobacteriovorax TaxID=2639665 RepID=UPI00371D01A9
MVMKLTKAFARTCISSLYSLMADDDASLSDFNFQLDVPKIIANSDKGMTISFPGGVISGVTDIPEPLSRIVSVYDKYFAGYAKKHNIDYSEDIDYMKFDFIKTKNVPSLYDVGAVDSYFDIYVEVKLKTGEECSFTYNKQ